MLQLWSALHSSQYNSRIAGGLRTEAVMLESLDMLIRQKHRYVLPFISFTSIVPVVVDL